MKATIATEEKAIVALVKGAGPRVHVAFEEGTQAQWLHDLLLGHAEHVVVCNGRGRDALRNGVSIGGVTPSFFLPVSIGGVTPSFFLPGQHRWGHTFVLPSRDQAPRAVAISSIRDVEVPRFLPR